MAVLTVPVAQGSEWRSVPRLRDISQARSTDITEAIREAGTARVELPYSVSLSGVTSNTLEVGAGWIRVVPPVSLQKTLPVATGDRGVGDGRIDVLSGTALQVDSRTQVSAIAEGDGWAIRWSALATPAGPAALEIFGSRDGSVAVQYLHVPVGLELTGVTAPAPGIRAASGTAHRLAPSSHVPALRLPGSGATPKATGPPPMNCNAEAGTWCDRADGPGQSRIFLSESFDDGLSTARGWNITNDGPAGGEWHQVSFADCTPGATSNPGRAWYYGQNATCEYRTDTQGSLYSPLIGPVTANTQMTLSSRIEYELSPVPGFDYDLAEIFVNGTPVASMPTLDAFNWYNFAPINLGAFAGQMIEIEFRFTSDNTVTMLGWFLDDVVVWDPTIGQPDCIINAGHAGLNACDDRLDDQWDFNEQAYCQGCDYVFYVLVECGREMHLPLEDMEGADVRVTNMLTGTAVPLRCINQTALADAGLGSYSGTLVADGAGAALDCCPTPAGPEVWWGPAFDETDTAGPGHVRWGLDAGCPIATVYDTTNPPGVECSELPSTCGGLLSQMSPGEAQVMDCSITDTTGLCGLYRVEVTSGGFVWSLFANCDGTNTPRFPIFFDCTEAWTAYNPLPELAVANLTTTGGCPDLQVDFEVVNIGCTDHPGPMTVRITSNCTPPDVLDHVVPGPIPAGGSVPVSVPFRSSCTPVRIEVFSDPANVIAECTETPGAASCSAEQGVDSLATFTCGCTAQLTSQAGADRVTCPGTAVTLDGSTSTIAPCPAGALYRWLDAGTGTVLRDWSATPTHVVVPSCPAGGEYELQVMCSGEACADGDRVRVSCVTIAPAAGPDVRACVGGGLRLDASASTVSNCAVVEYRWFDQSGTEVRGWATNPVLDLGAFNCAQAGIYQVEVRCAGSACSDIDEVTVTCVEVLADAGPDIAACEDVPFTITDATSTQRGCSEVVYAWFDSLGNPITAFSTDPTFSAALQNCPGAVDLIFVATCNDVGFENCGTFDIVTVTCTKPATPVPVATAMCNSMTELQCGVLEPGVTYFWDLDPAVDADGDTDPTNDSDLAGCNTLVTWPSPGSRPVRAWAEDAAGCRSFADVQADSFPGPMAPVPTAEPGCPGAETLLHCGVSELGVTYTWDTDVTTDDDGDTLPDNDAEATGCDVAVILAAGTHLMSVMAIDAGGCVSEVRIDVVIAPDVAPGEVIDERVTKSGSALAITWPAVPGAATYRVSRGTIGAWYSHAADDAAGRGTCDTLGATTFTDPDDIVDGGDWYYIVTAVSPCGAEGTPGFGFDGDQPFARPARTPTPTCP